MVDVLALAHQLDGDGVLGIQLLNGLLGGGLAAGKAQQAAESATAAAARNKFFFTAHSPF